jgi:hypothetical protein
MAIHPFVDTATAAPRTKRLTRGSIASLGVPHPDYARDQVATTPFVERVATLAVPPSKTDCDVGLDDTPNELAWMCCRTCTPDLSGRQPRGVCRI